MDKLKTYLRKLEKTKATDNYWLRFDARFEKSNQELQENISLLYPEISTGGISTVNFSEAKITKQLESCLAYPHNPGGPAKDQASHFLGLAQEIVGTKQCVYFKLTAEEDEHPTPGIFWDFWYLILSNSGDRLLGISGSACD